MVKSDRRSRKAELTRTSLKEAFIDLVLENNEPEAITISEVADRADFNRGTFYTHYQDKIDLLEDLYTDAIEGVRQSYIKPYKDLDRVTVGEDDPSLNIIFQHIEKHKKLFKALDLMGGDPNIYARLEEFLIRVFTEDIHIERKTDVSHAEYEIFVCYQINASIGIMKYWIRNDFAYTADYMIEQMAILYKGNVVAIHFKKNLGR